MMACYVICVVVGVWCGILVCRVDKYGRAVLLCDTCEVVYWLCMFVVLGCIAKGPCEWRVGLFVFRFRLCRMRCC